MSALKDPFGMLQLLSSLATGHLRRQLGPNLVHELLAALHSLNIASTLAITRRGLSVVSIHPYSAAGEKSFDYL
jgi:hypothetical protein